jgi:hypothetical protein
MGITIFHHLCSGSATHEVTVYPEFFRHAPACGCSEEDRTTGSGGFGSSIESPSCCQNITLYCKLPVNTIPAEPASITFGFVGHEMSVPDLPPTLSSEAEIVQGFHFNSHAPPLAGIALIHFIHQIKIPFPPSLA